MDVSTTTVVEYLQECGSGDTANMDLATIIGLLAGLGLVFLTMVLGGNPLVYLNIPSLLLVIGCTTAATLVHYRFRDVLGVLTTLKSAFIEKEEHLEVLITRLVYFSGIARREGVLSLEQHLDSNEDAFFARGIRLVIDGLSAEIIKDILITDVNCLRDRHASSRAILTTLGTYAPAFGMTGTLLGLVQMLSKLSDPNQIGGGMAVAMLTTLYGVILAYAIFLPAAGKLSVCTAREVFRKEIIIEGVLSIQAGENPRITEQRLKSYLNTSMRELIVRGHSPRG